MIVAADANNAPETLPPSPRRPSSRRLVAPPLRFADLFCGIGGFHLAAQIVCRERKQKAQCVFASDINPDAQKAYAANFGLAPCGDIRAVDADAVPDHDVLFAGFPCQTFSIIGGRKGFDDARGTLFFEIARILAAKRPPAFVLENVKQLRAHDNGRTLAVILRTLTEMGYHTEWRILNALDFGVPQKRERIFIIGFRDKPTDATWSWPTPQSTRARLADILEPDHAVAPKYRASARIQSARLAARAHKDATAIAPTIWHENKSGNISALPHSCALRAGASYNYLLVNGERRLTEREMLRLQGFPDTYQIVCNYQATRKQAGNSVAIPCVAAVLRNVLNTLSPTGGGVKS